MSTGKPRGYTNKIKATRPPVGPISDEARRLASIFCKHVPVDYMLPCSDCTKEAQAEINLSKERHASRT